MRDSLPSTRYSPVCNVLRLWRICLIPTYRVYLLYDITASLKTGSYYTIIPSLGFPSIVILIPLLHLLDTFATQMETNTIVVNIIMYM